MIGKMLGKALVVAIIVLFLSVSIQPAFADDINTNIEPKEEEETIIEDNELGGLNYGFIFVSATYREHQSRQAFRLRWTVIDCIDFNTGEVVMQEKTGRFGFCLFKFLPQGYDYRLIVPSLGGGSWCVIEDMGFFHRVHLHVDDC